ncbi:glyoxalase [Subtercola boreus]|uniref:Glyoxalase n=1 Tax=Subtercola boreus TaxID=120213 RepID=A0A3E0VFB2_9MICO|nr:VOC family protein [Subtercola boreus]RFA08602.1 glyoxalase [Subtercola boreus]TQL54461.1 catechol 2,3-dioxygenase-like lactoylglutathione lyase family enzyme [Subtercola boreus]
MSEKTARASVPRLRQVVLDTEDARGLAEFYRELLALEYLPGDEPEVGEESGGVADWLVLVDDAGARVLAFQRVESMPPPTWPEGPRPQMMHLDFWVSSVEELREQHAKAIALGASVLEDGTDDPAEAIVIFADPAGHPFCIFVTDE